MNLQGEKHVFFMGKTQLVPAGYVVNKNGLGGVGVGPQQNRNSHMENYGSLIWKNILVFWPKNKF